jgi:RNA polymerase sigma-70 factor (ECF subfamily)
MAMRIGRAATGYATVYVGDDQDAACRTVSPEDAERTLIRRYLETRDEASFRDLYRSTSSSVYGFLMRLTGEPEEAQELLQETWLRAASRLASFRFESSLSTWLRGIALRCWQEKRRAGWNGALGDVPHPIVPAVSPAAVDVWHALDSLPPGYRAAIVLHDLEGHTHEDIAGFLGIDPGTSRSQLARAREKLRRALSEGPKS